MELSAVWIVFHGVCLALGLIMPLGPQNMFLLTQGIHSKSFNHTLPALLATSLTDTCLILLAVYGVTLLLLDYPLVTHAMIIMGSLLLLYLGWHNWWAPMGDKLQQPAALSLSRQLIFALSVSILNPHAVLDTVAVIGPASLSYEGVDRTIFALTCVGVSWGWFLSLVLVGRWLSSRNDLSRLTGYLQKAAALMMWYCAGYLIFMNYIQPLRMKLPIL